MCLGALFSTPPIPDPPAPAPPAPQPSAGPAVMGNERRNRASGSSYNQGTSLTIPTPINIP